MVFLQRLRHAISYTDMFYSSQMLRYNHDTQYKTVTGGLITIGITAMVVIGFFSMISQTLTGTAIDYTLIQTTSNDPTYFQLISDQEHMFMFGLQLQPIDLSFIVNLAQGARYFDVTLGIMHEQYGIITNLSNVPLVQCTDAHWSMLPGMVQSSALLGYSNWLCPQLGQMLPLQGSFTSANNYISLLKVAPCTNESDPDRPCASQQEIDNFMSVNQNFYFSVNYINPVLNPSQPNYKSYYLQGNDYVIFSPTQACQAWFEFSDYDITTDNSLWPFSQYSYDSGGIVQNKAINHPFTVSNQSGYVNAYFSKSPNSLIYTRAVQKISAVFSYIGGLVGAITAVLLFLKLYTEVSLEMNIAMSLFKYPIKKPQTEDQLKESCSQDQEVTTSEETGFNIFKFISLIAYRLFKSFKFTENWDSSKILYELRKEVNQQLDIKTLLRRLISIENCMSCLLDKDQIEGLRYRKRICYLKAQELRKLLVDENEKNNVSEGRPRASIQFEFPKRDTVLSIDPRIMMQQNLGTPSFLMKFEDCDGDNVEKTSVNFKNSRCIKTDEVIQSLDQNDKRSVEENSSIASKKRITVMAIENLQKLKENARKNQINQRIWENMNQDLKKYINVNNQLNPKNIQKKETKKFKHRSIKIAPSFAD